MPPMWVYVAVAALIAVAALGVGQFAPGMGVVMVAGASGLLTAWSAQRAARERRMVKVIAKDRRGRR
ncbi:MAG: hypothetical protein AB1942_12880 [Pseudomonadota bacterium]